MDSRRRLVLLVEGGTSLKAACRAMGVTPKTGRKWVHRAREEGLDALAEKSRVPKSSPTRTAGTIEAELLALREEFPCWGGRKLAQVLKDRGGPALHPRTAERILSRHGLTAPPKAKASEELQRFVRPAALDLVQQDFKGMPRSCPYSVLTVLDDHARFCLGFEPVKDKTATSVQGALWEIFGRHGLPRQALMDNGDCWGAPASWGPTALEAWLMLLGVEPIHGRPHHPQTQGKVERFHLTAQTELGAGLVLPSQEAAREPYRAFVERYNWVRPHEALGMRVPGSLFDPERPARPPKLPEHEIPEGAISRKVDERGYISYRGECRRIGQGLAGQRVVLQEKEVGLIVQFARFELALWEQLR